MSKTRTISLTALALAILSGIQYSLMFSQARRWWDPAALTADAASFGVPYILAQPPDQPLNVVVIFPDDWRHDSLQDEHPDLIHTPFLSQLASEGIRFTHNAVTSSVCWLSRATLFTGRYASQHMSLRPFCPVFTDFQWWQHTWPYMLQKAGYWVGHIGKWQYRNDQGFLKNAFNFSRFHEGDHWHTMRDNVTRKALRKVHAADLAEEDAITFLRERPKDQPFAMTVAFYPPKAVGSDTDPGAQWSPTNEFYEMYQDHSFVPPYNFSQAFLSLPDFLKHGISRDRFERRYNTTEHYQEAMKRYFALVSHVDRATQNIIDELKTQGVYDNTIIIFTTDNGLMQGSHGLAGKWHPYEESIRVPLIIRDPRIPMEKRGTLDDSFTLNIDLAPTILSAAQVAPSDIMTGRDISELYHHRSELEKSPTSVTNTSWREDFYYELPLAQFPESSAVVTKEWKYIHWPASGKRGIQEQLFYLPKDPYELHDLLPHATDEKEGRTGKHHDDTATFPLSRNFIEKVLGLLRRRYHQLRDGIRSNEKGSSVPKCQRWAARGRHYDGG